MFAASLDRQKRHPSREHVQGDRAFPLFDFLFVVAIIGVLASTAIAGYIRYNGEPRHAEALHTLRAIQTSQLEYRDTVGEYADTFAELDFELRGGTLADDHTIVSPHYTYVLTAIDANGVSRSNFRVVAIGEADRINAATSSGSIDE